MQSTGKKKTGGNSVSGVILHKRQTDRTENRSKKKGPSHIDVFREWCKGCGICVAFCPKQVLALDENGHSYAKNPEACIQCGMCEMRCPDFAISVVGKKTGASVEG
ncbi:4Fe-4S dicluster domain-containing protein [Syntrophus aciditrophicus]|uniref:Ferridoxin n=1 Tax=Syntrophus aciditrophicus (strain SB) TaxID=56780 RepID=Q2LW28_SYNAS|nr:4Fe-4S binding protein [Syntrophus aciditrophicus]ABC78290.1 ferridoxin [Syntrophus aciditrophicus SB]OPY18415.1 MAG: 2-oxoglutarate-acceptor oxidoreductase subunit OorD [Syntrophus sp. PtaB.Bin075]